MIHILIADAHAAVRSCIRDLLSDAILETTFAEAADREQTLSLLATQEFSLALLDINTPGSMGLDLLSAIIELYPKLPVILLGTEPERRYARPCMDAGAAAYINVDDAPERLAHEVQRSLNERGEMR